MKKKLLGILALLVAVSTGLTSVFASTNILRISKNKNVRFFDPYYKGTIEFGDEVCIGTECFYVLSTNNETTILLSKYNLLVGNKVNATYVDDAVSYDYSPLGNEATNIQDERAIGAAAEDDEEGIFYGTVKYDEETINEALENYEEYLEQYDFTLDIRIPDATDMHYITCDIGDECNSSEVPEWAKNTTYWTKIAGRGDGTAITRAKKVEKQNVSYNVTAEGVAGVRPVLDVPTAQLESNLIEIDNQEDNEGASSLTQDDENVYVNVTPHDGYQVEEVTAKDANGKDVTVTKKDGKYSIKKSDITSKVTITINYKEVLVASAIENPETSDNIALMVALFSLSVIGLSTSLYLRKRNN